MRVLHATDFECLNDVLDALDDAKSDPSVHTVVLIEGEVAKAWVREGGEWRTERAGTNDEGELVRRYDTVGI